MKRRFVLFALFFGAAALIAPLPAAAQYAKGTTPTGGTATPVVTPPPGQQSPESFGPDGAYTAYQAARWVPWQGTPTPSAYLGTGYVGPSYATPAAYWTQLDLPNGASIDYVYAVVYDNDTGGGWYFDFHGYEGAPFEGTPHYVSFASGSTGASETPGYTAIQLYPNPPVVVHEWADLNGDDIQNIVSYNLSLAGTQTSGTNTLRFWGAAVHWTRTISPAPATATFIDVPVGSFGFQHIEALAASGITAGCDATHFCPDAPITRAQMAVFLAKALGLHWYE